MVMDVVGNILRREGSRFTDHPKDRGGPTRWGITGPTLCEYRELIGGYVPQTDEEIRNTIQRLTKTEARDIYEKLYVERPRFGEIKYPDLRALVIDSGVLHGRHRTARWLQGVVGVDVDGIVGSITLGAVNGRHWRKTHKELLARRYQGFSDFVQDRPDQLIWLEGWVNRANEFLLRL